MIALLLALAQAATPTPPPRPTADAVDWARLPSFPWRVPPRYDGATTAFVASEVAAGRCTASRDAAGYLLVVEVAVQVDAAGSVGAVRPRAVGCPAVEQYTAGIVSSRARDNIDPTAVHGAGWYRVATTFTWHG